MVVPFFASNRELELLRQPKPLLFHLSGCPESSYAKEYKAMPWYKRMFYVNPDDLYMQHFQLMLPYS